MSRIYLTTLVLISESRNSTIISPVNGLWLTDSPTDAAGRALQHATSLKGLQGATIGMPIRDPEDVTDLVTGLVDQMRGKK